MIAAAEAREAKNKAYVKPLPKSTDTTNSKFLRPAQEVKVNEFPESNNAQTVQAVEAIKAVEKSDAENLGYNPYESRAMTGGQARVATVAMTAGEINADNAPGKLKGDDTATSKESTIDVPIEFDYAFSTMVTSSSDQSVTQKSLSTMRKLIVNATTKGQADGEESAKFRRVRLSNPKIKEVITDIEGALELMMAVGFVLIENQEEGETYLVYPIDVGVPNWLNGALDRMEKYERGG
jgi:hypothetical protein